jgi:hypothetical protein
VCRACVEGKMHGAPHKAKTIISTTRCLELLHVDLFGPPSHESLGGKKYCLVIVDEYSRYCWVFFFKYKSETQRTMMEFSNQVQRVRGMTPGMPKACQTGWFEPSRYRFNIRTGT